MARIVRQLSLSSGFRIQDTHKQRFVLSRMYNGVPATDGPHICWTSDHCRSEPSGLFTFGILNGFEMFNVVNNGSLVFSHIKCYEGNHKKHWCQKLGLLPFCLLP